MAFKYELGNWEKILKRKPDGMPDHMNNGIMEHLSAFESEIEKYFPETTDKDLDFEETYLVEKLADECQNNFLEFINDSIARQENQKKFAIILDCYKRVLSQNNEKSSSHS